MPPCVSRNKCGWVRASRLRWCQCEQSLNFTQRRPFQIEKRQGYAPRPALKVITIGCEMSNSAWFCAGRHGSPLGSQKERYNVRLGDLGEKPLRRVRCFFQLRKMITGIPPSPLALDENATFQQILDVSQRGVCGTLCKFGIFGGGELPFKAVKQTVDYFSLAVIHRSLIDPLPRFWLFAKCSQALPQLLQPLSVFL